MANLDTLIQQLVPSQTVLLLGAGSSVPSGGPTGVTLARTLARDIPGFQDDSSAYSLAEICSVFEARAGRTELAKSVQSALSGLAPTGGLQLLPAFNWYRIYTTNFDQLVENVYAAAGTSLATLRSNYDLSRNISDTALRLYKIHGCISQDVGLGHQSRMLLTEADYEEPDNFREIAFRTLAADLMTKDVLIVGHSLADEHLRDLVRETLKKHSSAGTPGRIFVLSYEENENRASLLRERGAQVFFGDLDGFLDGLLSSTPTYLRQQVASTDELDTSALPSELLGITTQVAHASTLPSDVKRLFNGSAASYADVANQLTFARSAHDEIMTSLKAKPIAVLLGAGGVGKTTLARQLLVSLALETDAAWEHGPAFEFRAEHWIEYETRLRRLGKTAALLVDDCADSLSQVSVLCDHLGRTDGAALRIVLTATTGKWKQRSKSRFIFSHGNAFTLSQLTSQEISNLVDLTANNQSIRELVEQRFLSLPRGEQIRILKERCSADMYVCMKNIFASEDIDFILLREFGELTEEAQDIYRHVSALQALGARVHRQLVLRMLGIEVGSLASILDQLSGVVTESDISPSLGLFGWETRHRVVAEVIATFKYAQQSELEGLIDRLIDSTNPSVRLEVESLRSLCVEPFGIDRLSDPSKQVEFLRRIVRLLPGESIPRHRLIRNLIDQDRLDDAGRAINEATESVRMNPVLARYQVLLLIRRADLTDGLMNEDRVALLLDAEGRAASNLSRYPTDMHSYRIYGDVALAIARRTGDGRYLQKALEAFARAQSTILDPEFAEMRRRVETESRPFLSSP